MMPVSPAAPTGNDQSSKSNPSPRPMQKRTTISSSFPPPSRIMNKTVQPIPQCPPSDKTRSKSMSSQSQRKPISTLLARSVDKPERPGSVKIGLAHSSRLENRTARPVVPGSAKNRSRQPSPKTLVEDILDYSEPMSNNNNTNKHGKKSKQAEKLEGHNVLHNLEIENVVLNNELNVVNREVMQLVERLRTSDNVEKQCLESYIKELEAKDNGNDAQKQWEDMLKQKLEEEIEALKDSKVKLEEKIRVLEANRDEETATTLNMESQLRKTQTVANDLQKALAQSLEEYQKLESDYDAYKTKVKNMMTMKDLDIKSLRELASIKSNSKCLAEHIHDLKKENDDLQLTASQLRDECKNTKMLIDQLVSKSSKAERLYVALKHVLKHERPERLRCKNDCEEFPKDFICMQLETDQQCRKLQSTFFDNASEGRDISVQSLESIMTGALNVADYGKSIPGDEDNDYMNETLIQKQKVIDKLLIENSGLKKSMEPIATTKNVAVQLTSDLNVKSTNSRNGFLKGIVGHVFRENNFSLNSNKKMLFVFFLVGLYTWVFVAFQNPTAELPQSVLNFI